ncbi:SNF2 family DNA or RNA helicase [Alkalibacillus filiformis]|uniref:SNF2 family DNA or RNA helicase n=1 Tax=Alkalibacillus filiformis TaxID=200990 RepID=A0ABU0DTY8_9BACI|nr:DEAD/DEAH box helicase [Alkalibacillus filiformis]MDQ0351929.1 SNF2 family DNA or RNA helicase [Alkalibacillus filiformis]
MLTDRWIKDLFSTTVYQRGLVYYNLGKVVHMQYNEDLDQYQARVLGSELYNVKVKVDSSQVSYSCDCPAHSQYNQCKHSVAVLLKISNQLEAEITHYDDIHSRLKRYNSFQEQRDYSTEMIQLLSNHLQGNSTNKETLQVEFILKPYDPLLHDQMLSIEMKLGVGRTYVVKSLKKFLESVDEQKEHYFTPNFSYDPEIHQFTEEDQQAVNLLLEMYRNDVFYDNRWQTPPSSKAMTIPPVIAQQLLRALADCHCQLEYNNEYYGKINWVENGAPFQFSLNQNEEQYELTLDDFHDAQYFKDYGIIRENETFFKLNNKQMNIMNDLYKLLYRSKQASVPIKKQQADSFISHVIPNLEELGHVQMSQEVQQSIINPPLQATMHLDLDEDRLTANVRYNYDDIVIDPMQPDHIQKENHDHILVRDVVEENKIMSLIEYASFKFNGQELYLDDEEEVFTFLYDVLPQLDESIAIYSTQPVRNLLREDIEYPTVNVEYDSNENFLEVDFDLGDIDQSEISQIIQSVVEKKRFYRLPNGSYVPLQDDSFAEMSHMLKELRLNTQDINEGTIQLPAYRGLQIDEISQGLKRKYNEAFEKLIQDIKNPENFEATIPLSLNADMREYQKVGFQWLKSLSRYQFGGILADDMGLGKTLQAIAFLQSEKEENATVQPAIIVAPASLVYNWQAEFEKFAPTMNIKVVHGSVGERETVLKHVDQYDVIITSYPLIRQDIEHYQSMQFSTLILDEAQAIKNSLTKQAKAVRAIRARKRFALSGTPIENSLDELWSIFDVILPGFFPAKKEFRNLSEEQISRMSRPFILRRIKEDVLTELPDKIETVQHSELTTKQKQLYLGYLEKIQGAAANALSTEGFQKNRMKILAGLTRLRQLCCHPLLFIEDYDGESGKLNQLLEMVETARESGKRILIFSQFSSMLKIIHNKLFESNQDAFYLDGQTPSKDRVEMVERFNEGEKDIFLISLKAGGTGLNLTGADTVILYDLWWNPAVEEQAAGRAHRMGQQNVVQVFRLITRGTIEEKIHSLQQRKRELIENIIQPGETTFQSLSEQDIRELLNV